MNLYRVKLSGQYNNNIYSFVRYDNVIELAKYLNDRLSRFPLEPVLSVALVQGYEDGDDGISVLSQHEYNIQYFYETYEMRLIQYYREHHAV